MLNDSSNKKRGISSAFIFILLLSSNVALYAQQPADSLLTEATLPNLVQYALKRQPAVQQALIDEQTTQLQIKSKLADWYPQLNFGYVYQHNFQVQTSIIGGNPVQLGVNNTSALQFGATQNIFNRDLLLARQTRGQVEQYSRLQTSFTKIDVVTMVEKAFYDVLTTGQQLKVVNENIVRLERSLKDARARFDAGVADKTDYKRATIALNNALASKRTYEEALIAKTIYLKAVVNYPENAPLAIVYDSTTLVSEIALDTLTAVDYTRRVEYRQLSTQRELQQANLKYQRWSYLPTVSASGAYNLNFLNNRFGKLYNTSYPNSFAGLTMSVPIFQGGKRKYNIEQAEWQIKRTDLEIVKLENNIYSQYSLALANYKSNLYNMDRVRENVLLAQEVYDVIDLQYRAGIKTYLEVTTAETDLRTAQINYFNALYQVLVSKIDVQRSTGDLKY
jgi:outer membrane protein